MGLAVSELQRQAAENHSKVQRQLDGFDRKLQEKRGKEIVKWGVVGWLVTVGWFLKYFCCFKKKFRERISESGGAFFFLKMKYLFFGSFGMECVFPQGREDVETL